MLLRVARLSAVLSAILLLPCAGPVAAAEYGNRPIVLGPSGTTRLWPNVRNSAIPPVVALTRGPIVVVNLPITTSNIFGPRGSATSIAFNILHSHSMFDDSQLFTVLSGPNNYGDATVVIAALAPGAALPIGPVALSGATYAESAGYTGSAAPSTRHGIYASAFSSGGNPYVNLGSASVIFGLRR